MSDATVEQLVEKAQSQETFSFSEVIQGRGYPKDEVEIFLDEGTAYEIQKLEHKIADQTDNDEADRLSEGLIPLRAKLAESRFVFKITGVPSEVRENLLEQVQKEIPPKFDHNKNFITGQVEKVEIENPKRDRLYTNMLWQASIEQIVSPTGAVDTAPDLATVTHFRSKAPMSQLHKFNDALEKLVVASEAFEVLTDDDF